MPRKRKTSTGVSLTFLESCGPCPGIKKFIEYFPNSIIKEIRMSDKLVGVLESKKAGTAQNGSTYTDVTIGTQKIKLWDTIKTKAGGIIGNPAKTQLDGCRIGDTVEAKVYTNQGGYKSINEICVQNAPGAAEAGEPVTGESNVSPDRFSGSTERQALVLIPAAYRFIAEFVGGNGIKPEDRMAYLEENKDRFIALAHWFAQAGMLFIEGEKHVVGEE